MRTPKGWSFVRGTEGSWVPLASGTNPSAATPAGDTAHRQGVSATPQAIADPCKGDANDGGRKDQPEGSSVVAEKRGADGAHKSSLAGPSGPDGTEAREAPTFQVEVPPPPEPAERCLHPRPRGGGGWRRPTTDGERLTRRRGRLRGGGGENRRRGRSRGTGVDRDRDVVRLPVLVWEVGGRKSDVLLRVVGEEDRQQPEHDVGHPHGSEQGGLWHGHSQNLPQGRVRLRTAADIPVSPGLPKPNILSELQSLGIPRILNFLKPKAPALTFLSERGRAASMLMALCHGKCRGGLERSGVLEAPPVPPGPPATVCYLPRKRASWVS